MHTHTCTHTRARARTHTHTHTHKHTHTTVAMEAGANALLLLRWLHMMLDMRVEAVTGRNSAVAFAYSAHALGAPPDTALERE